MRRLLLALAILASCTTAPTASPAPTATPDAVTRGGQLRVAQALDVTTLDPWTASDPDTLEALSQVYEPLARLDPVSLRPVPLLATKWTASSDARIWTFTLRSGVKFHDGTPLDAAAVAYDFERARDFLRLGLGPLIDSVTASDPSTVVFTLKTGYAALPATLASTSFGLVSPACVKAGPAWATPATRCAAGTGPFRVEPGAWKTGDRLVLTRNASYWGTDADGRRLPFLDSVAFIAVRDENARVGGLHAAQVEVALDLGPATARALRADPNLAAQRRPYYPTVFVGITPGPGPFAAAEVRRAAAMAVDRDGLARSVYSGEARAAAQLVPPGLLGHDDTVTQFAPGDAAAAKKLLADAGFASGVNADLWYSPDASDALPDPKRVAEAVAADLARGGITVNVRTEDAALFIADAKGGRLTLWIEARAPERADPDDFLADATTNTVALELLRRARAEIDESKRAELYKQAAKLIQQDVSRIPLLHTGAPLGLTRRVHGLTASAVGGESLATVWMGQ
ncbi:MAG TPA: ABC transporter substrate-binding protein [Candidatus Acidoferrales bacterium]|nr:ABC transporter substrate-binding protein [Candidatus Acidoferrales bacterium]